MTLSSLGGVVGIAVATVASILLAKPMSMSVSCVFNGPIDVLAFAFLAAIGVLSGFLPAKRVPFAALTASSDARHPAGHLTHGARSAIDTT